MPEMKAFNASMAAAQRIKKMLKTELEWACNFVRLTESGAPEYDWAVSSKQLGRLKTLCQEVEDSMTYGCRMFVAHSAVDLKRSWSFAALSDVLERFKGHLPAAEKLEHLNWKLEEIHKVENQ